MLHTGPQRLQRQQLGLVLEPVVALVAGHRKVANMLYHRNRFEEHEFDHLGRLHSLLPVKCQQENRPCLN